MRIHQKCLKAVNPKLNHKQVYGNRTLQILKFVNEHDNWKLSDIREAIWPGLFDRTYKNITYIEVNVKYMNPERLIALAKHTVSGYGSDIFAKCVRRGWLVYDTQYRWHITELGVSKLIERELLTNA